MEKKYLVYPFFLFVTLLLLPGLVQAINLCRWQGYANMSGTLVNTTDYITVYNGTKTYNATIFSNGYYIADVQTDSTNVNISFKICGVDAVQGGQAWSCPATDYNNLNLSISKLTSGASCSYSCACSGGYCCSGATQYTRGEGTGTCQASACSAPSPGGGDGGGGGAGGTTTTVVTSTTTLSLVSPSSPGIVTIESTKATDLKVYEVKIEVSEAVSNVQVTVKESSLPSGATVAITSDAGATYKYIDITTTVPSAKLEKVKIKFKVERSWLTANNIASSSIALQRYANGVWNKLTTTQLSSDATYIYFEAETTALSTFAVTGEKKAVVLQACPFDCCAGEVNYTDKSCASGYECKNRECIAVTVTPKVCPTCSSCSEWSDCVDDKQARTCYYCNATTDYTCKDYTETKDCKKPTVIKVWMVLVGIAVIAIVAWLVKTKIMRKIPKI